MEIIMQHVEKATLHLEKPLQYVSEQIHEQIHEQIQNKKPRSIWKNRCNV